MACKILVLQPGFKLLLSAVKVKSPNHWTALEFPKAVLFYFLHNSYLDIPFGTGLSCQHQNPLSATRVFEPNSVTLYVHPAFLLFFFSLESRFHSPPWPTTNSCFSSSVLSSKIESNSHSVVSDSLNVAHQAPLSMTFSREEYWGK